MGCINKSSKYMNIITPYKCQYMQLCKNTAIDYDSPTNIINNERKEKYKMIKEIGKGSFGSVYLVEHISSQIFRALKIMKKTTQSKYNDSDKEERFIKKVEMLMALDHPNVLKVYEYYVDDNSYYILSEYINGGELSQSIFKKVHLSEEQIKYIMKQLLSAINYLHINDIIHRDLKLENILIEKENKTENKDDSMDYLNIKLIDFESFGKVLKNGYHSNRVGSPLYIAPEVLMKNYNEKCDIWSAGVILYYLLVGHPPFSGNTIEELFSNILTGIFSLNTPQWSLISSEAKDLVSTMLKSDFNKRSSASNCLKHPWFTDDYRTKQKERFVIVLNKLINYKECNQFKNIALAYIIYCLNSNNQFGDLKIAFQAFDNDSDGLLSYDDILNAYKRYFCSNYFDTVQENRVIEILSSIDSNRDNKITYEEFLFVTVNREMLMSRENLKIAFDYFDQDNDGLVSREDLYRLFTNNKTQIDYWLANINCNDNHITYEEFIKAMKKE